MQNSGLLSHPFRETEDIPKAMSYADWDLNLLQDHFSFEPQHENSQVDFLFAFPEIFPLDETINHSIHIPISISPIVSEEKSILVKDAFNMATGRWIPIAHNFQADEEKNLLATQGAKITSENLDKWDCAILREGFPPAARDRLLVMLVGACNSEDLTRMAGAFPSCEDLGYLVKSFLAWHIRQEHTWIHLPTFSASHVSIELLAAIVAGGAVRSSNRAVQKFGLAIHEILSVQLWKTVGNHATYKIID